MVAKILDATTKIEGTWYEIYGRLSEGAHDWKRKEILPLGMTRHISWRFVELKVIASKWRRCGSEM